MTEWAFKSFRPTNPHDRFPIFGRFPIRRACPFIGTARDALAFARRACEHLTAKNVLRVEAWTEGQFEPEVLPGGVTFRLKPAGGSRWIAEQGPLHHGGNFPDLDSAINYALFRGTGKLCRIEVLNAAEAMQWLVLADMSDLHPYEAIRSRLNPLANTAQPATT